jgi:hypothetical protein
LDRELSELRSLETARSPGGAGDLPLYFRDCDSIISSGLLDGAAMVFVVGRQANEV